MLDRLFRFARPPLPDILVKTPTFEESWKKSGTILRVIQNGLMRHLVACTSNVIVKELLRFLL